MKVKQKIWWIKELSRAVDYWSVTILQNGFYTRLNIKHFRVVFPSIFIHKSADAWETEEMPRKQEPRGSLSSAFCSSVKLSRWYF